MNIVLISDSKENLDVLHALQNILKREILDVEIKTIIVPQPDNIPAKIEELSPKTSLFFVLVYYEELDFKIKALLNKLITLEVKNKSKIIKVIEEKEEPDEFSSSAERTNAASKFSKMVLDFLFHSEHH